LTKKAVEDTPFAEELAPHLQDMTAIAWSYEDPSAHAKVIRDFTKANAKTTLKVKCGVMDGRVVDVSGWADMPSRTELLGMIVGQLTSGPSAIVSQMMKPAQQLVSLIDAWKEKLETDQ